MLAMNAVSVLLVVSLFASVCTALEPAALDLLADVPRKCGGADSMKLTTPNHQRTLQGLFKQFATQTSAPAATPAAPATPSAAPAPATGKFGRIQQLKQALRCQIVYQKRFGGNPNNLRAALGPNCQDQTLNPIQCCTDAVNLLNQPDLRGCICNPIVYNQLCGQVAVAGLTCETLLPTLQSCGLQC